MSARPDIIYWLALQRIFFYQPQIALDLIEAIGPPHELFSAAIYRQYSRCLPEEIKKFREWDSCAQDLKKCEASGINIITYADPLYPTLLKHIYAPPLLMMVRGEVDCLSRPCVGIVGARKATAYGREVAFEIARELAQHGITVVSGMAYGIDAAAHKGALKAGSTVAVWGSGIDICYPPTYANLSMEIMRSGCVVSEFPLATQPFPQHFPQRNRIISGLSLGVVVVEAATKSGSLITARLALEQGREVFSVPGNARGVASQGTHALLRHGATLVEKGDDVIEVILSQLPPEWKNPRHFVDDINNGPPLGGKLKAGEIYSLDSIVELCALDCGEVLRQITLLTLQGKIEELPGKRFRLKRGYKGKL